MKRLALTIAAIAVLMALIPSVAAAEEGWTVTRLTDNDYNDYRPQIDGGQVVWVGSPGGSMEIFLAVYEAEEAVVPATIDIDPDTLNLKSNGKWITCYIELPEGYDVNDIAVASILLNGAVAAEPKPVEIGDYDADGVANLMVKFDMSAVQDLLEPADEVELTVSGELGDGTSFEGSDTIKVIDKGAKGKK